MSLQFQHLQCSVIIYTGRKFQKIHRYNFFLFASTVYVFLVDDFFFIYTPGTFLIFGWSQIDKIPNNNFRMTTFWRKNIIFATMDSEFKRRVTLGVYKVTHSFNRNTKYCLNKKINRNLKDTFVLIIHVYIQHLMRLPIDFHNFSCLLIANNVWSGNRWKTACCNFFDV